MEPIVGSTESTSHTVDDCIFCILVLICLGAPIFIQRMTHIP